MNTQESRELLDRSMVRALAWNAAARWISQILSWLSTIVVARLLTPSDYGLIGMACLYLNLAQLVSQAGIGDTVVALRNLAGRQIAELNTVALVAGCALTAISCELARPIAAFFAEPRLANVIIISSSLYFMNAFQIIPKALLQKELRFKRIAAIETVRTFLQILTTILLAWYGWAYWSLVAGYLIASLTVAVLTYFSKPHGFAMPNLRALGRELRFSRHVMLSSIASYVYENADFMVAGRMLGEIPLGNYTVAWTISSAPVDKIANLVTGVTPTFFAAVQDKKAELRRYLLRLTEVISLVTLPASVGLVVVADYAVRALLGPKWQGVISPLRLLGLFCSVRSVATILPNVLVATGQAAFAMYTSVGGSILMVIAFVIGSHWGTSGIALAWVVGFPIIIAPVYYRVFETIELPASDYLTAISPAVAGSLVMALFTVAARLLVPQARPAVGLGFTVFVGVTSYLVTLWVAYRSRLGNLVALASQLLRGRTKIAAPPRAPFREETMRSALPIE